MKTRSTAALDHLAALQAAGFREGAPSWIDASTRLIDCRVATEMICGACGRNYPFATGLFRLTLETATG